MDKLTLAHEWAMKHGSALTHKTVFDAWQYADAMQAEADKREDKTRPEVLCEVDWNQAPSNAEFYLMRYDKAVWSDGSSIICPAPTFGFTGTHIVERPNGF